jgi:hypothetical protein
MREALAALEMLRAAPSQSVEKLKTDQNLGHSGLTPADAGAA